MKNLIDVTKNNDIDPGSFWYMDVGINNEANIFIEGSITSDFSQKK